MPANVELIAGPAVESQGRLRRDELLQRLSRAARIVVVNAEQGSGKTELMSQWLSQQPSAAYAWVALDAHASDPHVFWLRILQAMNSARPETFGALVNDFASGRIPPHEALALITSAAMRDPHPVTLAIDDLHYADAELQEQLVSLLRRAPHMRLFATSRTNSRFEIPLTAAGLDVTLITATELAFTSAELAAVASTLPYQLSHAELATLRRSTHGHPLAVRLALSVMTSLSRDGAHRPTTQEVTRGVESLLADFAPSFETAADRELALVTSLVPEVDEALAERLGGASSWAAFERFTRLGYGRLARHRGRPVFRMHTLTTTALRPRAIAELPAERVAEVRQLAFEQLYDKADPIDILEMLVEGGMDRAIFPHFVRNYSEISPKRADELVAITDGISPERLAREGTIPIMIAVALSDSSVVPTPRMRELLQIGMPTLENRAFEARGAAGRLLLLARFAGLRASREYEAAVDAGEEFFRQSPIGTPSWRSGMHAARLEVIVTEVLAARIAHVFPLAEKLVSDPHLGRQAYLHSILAFAYARMGDMRATKRELSAVDATRLGWQGSMPSVAWHLASALRAASLGRHDAAIEILQPVIERLDEYELWPGIVWTRGMVRLMSGQAAHGFQELDAALSERQDMPISEGWAEQLQTLRGELLLATGDLVRARASLTHDGTDPTSQLARARLALLASQPSEALARLDAIDAVEFGSVDDIGSAALGSADVLYPAQVVQQQFLRAAVHARQGDPESASTLATQAFLALDRLDNRLPLSWVPAGDVAVIRTLVPADIWRAPSGSPFASDEVMLEELSKREALVLLELARGGSIDDIAGELHVSSNTIKTQTRSIYKKLKVSSRAEALIRARQMGLV